MTDVATVNDHLDERDTRILAERLAELDAIEGPRVGDYIEFANGVVHRFAHDWDISWERTGLQTTKGGSWYLGDGYLSFSGGLDPIVPRSTITPTDEVRLGSCWFFHHNMHRAHNGVDVRIPLRVFRTTEEFTR